MILKTTNNKNKIFNPSVVVSACNPHQERYFFLGGEGGTDASLFELLSRLVATSSQLKLYVVLPNTLKYTYDIKLLPHVIAIVLHSHHFYVYEHMCRK